MPTLRLLTAGDEALVETFLLSHRDSSMFLRSNLRRDGFAQGTYVAAFRDGEIVGVVSHAAFDNLSLQAPEFAAELAVACVQASQRVVRGLLGPEQQVRRARSALGLDAAPAITAKDESLYALSLSELVIPAALTTGAVVCRAPTSTERELLVDWRVAYEIETLGGSDSPDERAHAASFLDRQLTEGSVRVATVGGTLVSLSALNAAMPDIVQLGGIYTPPEHRGRGFARAAVASTLLAARDTGAARAVLFTANPSAMRTYEALGFRRTGSYTIVLFRPT